MGLIERAFFSKVAVTVASGYNSSKPNKANTKIGILGVHFLFAFGTNKMILCDGTVKTGLIHL
jgi:hypothetical protein